MCIIRLMKIKPNVLVIVGPTASGKSDLAVRLALKFNGEIISADSRQVYKGLDIGTGKITKKEMRGITHHLLDVADPRKYFSVAQYKKIALDNIRYIVSKNKLSIVVGGTGFYIDALTGRISLPDVPPNPLLRKRLEKKSIEVLYQILQKKDPRRAKSIDRHNKVRLIRALEIINVLGVVPKASPKSQEPKSYIYIGLKPRNLDERIYKRLHKRLDGIIREAKKLIEQKAITYKRMHELGLEYRYVALYLQNKISKQEMINKLYIETRHYAKRQMTWFRRNKKIKWFRPEKYKEIEKYTRRMLGYQDWAIS